MRSDRRRIAERDHAGGAVDADGAAVAALRQQLDAGDRAVVARPGGRVDRASGTQTYAAGGVGQRRVRVAADVDLQVSGALQGAVADLEAQRACIGVATRSDGCADGSRGVVDRL